MIKEAMAAYAGATQKAWKHDRSKTVGASEIGLCARRMWYLKHDTPPDPDHEDRWGAKKRGDLIEAFWEKALRASIQALPGHRLRYAGRYQKTLVDAASFLSATPDGLVVEDTGNCFIVELKSVDPRAKLERPKEEHTFQCQVQMGLTRRLTNYQPTHAILTYVDASFLDESREFRIEYEEGVFAAARSRARAIMTAASAEDVRPEGYIAGGAECEYCAYRHRCSAMRAGQVPGREASEIEAATLQRLIGLAQKRESALERALSAEREARELAQGIKDILREHGTRRVDVEGLRITWSALKGRPAWDMPRLREAAAAIGLDLSPFETVGDPSDRLTVKLSAVAEKAA